MGNGVANKLIVNLYDAAATETLTRHLARLLRELSGSTRPVVSLCIGSDRYTGDCLGPLVGSYLQEHTRHIVYGTLDHPVHAGNLVDTVKTIETCYDNPLIIAVDACLGKRSEIGNIEAWQGGVEAGIAVGNALPRVGHITVIGVVNSGGNLGYLDLQSTPLAIVVRLSKVIGMAMIAALFHAGETEAAAGLKLF